MTNYNDDDLDDEFEENGEPLDEEEEEARPAGNRNFLLALGILGGILLLLVIGLVVFTALRGGRGGVAGNDPISQTNAAIFAANTQTAGAATEIALNLLTPSATATVTVTPTATNTQVVAQAAATETLSPDAVTATAAAGGAAGVGDGTTTPEGAAGGQDGATATQPAGAGAAVDTRTATVGALLTQRAQTSVAQTQAAGGQRTNTPIGGVPTQRPGAGAGTATRLPQSGFAEDVGLPGLFGMALGLVLVIVLVRRLRLSTNQ